MTNTYMSKELFFANKTIKFIQISDTHLLSDIERNFLGINSYKSYKAVVKHIVNNIPDYDFIIATGDISQEYSIKPYNLFSKYAKSFNKPVFWLPGNHDFPDKIAITLLNNLNCPKNIKPEKHLLLNERWQVFLLDSQVKNHVYGELSKNQLDFLEQKLSKYQNHYSIISMHHHILPTQSAWLDQHNLRNAEKLRALLKNYPNVKAVVSGHVHQEFSGIQDHYQVLTTPATSIQFKPKCDNFTLDNLQPGWREFTLYNDGSFESVIKRLNTNEFIPDFNSKGY